MNEIRILLVEDERKIADSLLKGLSEHNFQVDVAYDGISGKEKIEKGNYNLLILDINLPGVSGYELCRRNRVKHPNVPVIMLTALNTRENKIEGFDAGADDYIVKPFDFEELLARIRAILKRVNPGMSPGNMLKVSDLVLNLDSKEVKRGDETISLTSKEFQLLEYLIRNKGRIVSRSEIALNVWDIDFDTKTNVIDVYVNFLRKKLDKNADKKLIHTQVGQGYIIKE
jgi:two-component system copper resistance phosphate regulon response regulator CusR